MDWGEAGDMSVRPQTRLQVVPFADTKSKFRFQKQRLEEIREKSGHNEKREDEKPRKKAQKKVRRLPANVQDEYRQSDSSPFDGASARNSLLMEQTAPLIDIETDPTKINNAPRSPISKSRLMRSRRKAKEAEALGEFQCSASRCWLSAAFNLLPGKYLVFADVSFADGVPTPRLYVRPEEYWRTSAELAYESSEVYLQISSATSFSVKPATPPRRLFPQETRKRRRKSVKTYTSRRGTGSPKSPLRRKQSSKSAFQSFTESNSLMRSSSTYSDGFNAEDDATNLSVKTNRAEPRKSVVMRTPAQEEENLEEINDMIKNHTFGSILVDEERWPFTVEIQAETASKGLVNMLADLRNEANLVQAEVMSLRANVL